MPLLLSRKQELVEELSKRFDENDWCLLASASGLTVAEIMAFRKKLRENGISFKVYKNKLIKRVVENRADAGEMMKLLDNLKGPTGVAFSQSDPIVATKMFTDYASENEKFTLKAACYEKSYWDASTMKQMSQLGSKSAIYGKLISTMKAPLFKLVYVLQAPSSKLVGTLKAVSEKS